MHEATKEALGEKIKQRRKRIFLNAEIEKERQSKEQLFLKWLRPRIIMTSEKKVYKQK